jgi:hypoxanthine phosphoribosyltransferase
VASDKKDELTWTGFDQACEILAREIRRSTKPGQLQRVYGFPRGGLVVAVRLSHLLELEFVQNKDEIDLGTLVVDDIADSGATMMELNDWLAALHRTPLWKLQTATIYECRDSKFKPTYSVFEKTNWVVFPWETKDSTKTSSRKE